MASRRQFLQAALAAAALPLSGAPALAVTAGGAPALQLFVFDNRLAPARDAASRMARAGVTLAETDGDLTDLWREDLRLRWRRAPMTLAGITTARGLFVLETLAADWRMHVAFRRTLTVTPETAVSWIIAPRGPAARRA